MINVPCAKAEIQQTRRRGFAIPKSNAQTELMELHTNRIAAECEDPMLMPKGEPDQNETPLLTPQCVHARAALPTAATCN